MAKHQPLRQTEFQLTPSYEDEFINGQNKLFIKDFNSHPLTRMIVATRIFEETVRFQLTTPYGDELK